MSNNLKVCPTLFSRGNEKFFGRGEGPFGPYIVTDLLKHKSISSVQKSLAGV